MNDGAPSIPKVVVLDLVDTFFKEFVFSVSTDSSQQEDFTAGVENLKCILNDISKTNNVLSLQVADICNGKLTRAPEQRLRQQDPDDPPARQVQKAAGEVFFGRVQ